MLRSGFLTHLEHLNNNNKLERVPGERAAVVFPCPRKTTLNGIL